MTDFNGSQNNNTSSTRSHFNTFYQKFKLKSDNEIAFYSTN